MQHPSVILYLCLWQLIMVSQYDLYVVVEVHCGYGTWLWHM